MALTMLGRNGPTVGKWGRSINANDGNAALTVNQRGSGDILDIQDGGLTVFKIPDGGGAIYADDKLFRLGTDGDQVLLNRSAVLNADTALASVLIGTVESQALAANSLMIANSTSNGDIALYTNKGGHSQMGFWLDGSAGDTALLAASGASIDHYVAGVKELDHATGAFAFQVATAITGVSSIAIASATPFGLTNGQLVNIALTSQTVGATTLTIPNFASVVDTFAFVTLAQALVNKTLTAPVIQGIVTAGTGLTMPAFAGGGTIAMGSNYITIAAGYGIGSPTTDSYVVYGGGTIAGGALSLGANIALFGQTYAGVPSGIKFYTRNLALGASVERLLISGGIDIAVATWAAITHTGLVITSGATVEGAGTGANGFKIKNPKNAAATALSGTQLDVEIDIGGVPYYFTVYPTKA